jgi:hypothetical protein
MKQLLLVLILAVLLGGCASAPLPSQPVTTPIRVDGSAHDWGSGTLITDKDLGIILGARHDEQRVYLLFATRSRKVLRAIAHDGLSLWLDETDRGVKHRGVTIWGTPPAGAGAGDGTIDPVAVLENLGPAGGDGASAAASMEHGSLIVEVAMQRAPGPDDGTSRFPDHFAVGVEFVVPPRCEMERGAGGGKGRGVGGGMGRGMGGGMGGGKGRGMESSKAGGGPRPEATTVEEWWQVRIPPSD